MRVDIEIRRASPTDADTLTAIAYAAKRYWHYPEASIQLWQAALTVTADFVEHHAVSCAVRESRLIGFYALSGTGSTRELAPLWVVPEQIGWGVGTRLLQHALQLLRTEGGTTLRIVSDPSAEGFYQKLGARRMGEVPSPPAGRTLPLLVLEVE